MSTEDPQQQPTEAEMQAALQEELKKVRVEQVVLESALSILNVAIMRAGMMPGTEQERDLDQVRVGIEGVRALLPLVELIAGPEQARPIKDALSQLQMVYVQAAEQEGGGAASPQPPSEAAPGPGAGAAPQPPQRPAGPGSAQSSGRLWVPGQ
ncbi:hypothetical protein VSS74_14120 [Conexibacter stalactiti]|uniref:DUF1844 domain-containing protein n=1 Tax=Conexibacter stalactiti TaxID=1940611 RepID=A0ABU4HQD3_9ACTN|nr:hypothetical protein [Conexibacter stalactiti]MDW5595482.1 hypothetical protein [Conexibacter stalactiti]MEC5036124.1 hypothetical protein [Conexibacter stalactiti]